MRRATERSCWCGLGDLKFLDCFAMALSASGAVTVPISAAGVALIRERRQRGRIGGGLGYAFTHAPDIIAVGPERKSMKRRHEGAPMDLANMRQNGVRSLSVSCLACHRSVRFNVDTYYRQTAHAVRAHVAERHRCVGVASHLSGGGWAVARVGVL